MKIHLRGNLLWSLCLVMLAALTGCADRSEPDSQLPPDGKVRLAIHIAPVNSRAGETTNYFDSEKIKSLRIIMVGTDPATSVDTVEFNQYMTVQNGNVPADDFYYDYVWRTKPGDKKFYIIANEESVNKVFLESAGSSGSTEPDDNEGSSLTDILNKYVANTLSEDLDQTMNSIYFTPSYTKTESEDIFLPYSSFYGNITIEEKDKQDITMYLVPVATKFVFNFTNGRALPMNVSNISLSYTNTQNFLFGQVASDDQEKKIDEESFYWVDWLAKISELSLDNTDYYPNLAFNEKYGWITNYKIPAGNGGIQSVFVASDEIIEIPACKNFDTEDAEPGFMSVGPFYVPESINFINPNNAGSTNDSSTETNQSFYLTMVFEDTAEGKDAPDFTNVAIANLKALFRNTYCIINIKMGQGPVEVYAEIAEWNTKQIQGWVTEGQAPPGLTFP